MGSYGQLGTDGLQSRQSIPKKISAKAFEIIKPDSDRFNLALHPLNVKKLIGSIKMVLSFDASFIFMSKNPHFLFIFILFIDIPENYNLLNLSENETFEMKNSRVSETSSKYEGTEAYSNRFDPTNISNIYSSKTDKNESFS